MKAEAHSRPHTIPWCYPGSQPLTKNEAIKTQVSVASCCCSEDERFTSISPPEHGRPSLRAGQSPAAWPHQVTSRASQRRRAADRSPQPAASGCVL